MKNHGRDKFGRIAYDGDIIISPNYRITASLPNAIFQNNLSVVYFYNIFTNESEIVNISDCEVILKHNRINYERYFADICNLDTLIDIYNQDKEEFDSIFGTNFLNWLLEIESE